MKAKYVEMYMRQAIAAAATSEAIRKKVGCVVVTKNGVTGIGLNGTPPKWPYGNLCEELTPCGTSLVSLPIVRHAERAALVKLQDDGVCTKGATAFITYEPCRPCCERLFDAGIEEVIYLEPYRCHKGIEYLDTVGIKHWRYENEELLGLYNALQVEETEWIRAINAKGGN